MKINFKCYDCIFKLILELSEKLGKTSDEKKKALANEMLEHFTNVSSRGGSPPELLAHLWGDINVRESGTADPMAEIKHNSTQLALKLLPQLRKIVEQAANSFDAALCLAIAGNIIDYGINRDLDLSGIEKSIVSVIDQPYVPIRLISVEIEADLLTLILPAPVPYFLVGFKVSSLISTRSLILT